MALKSYRLKTKKKSKKKRKGDFIRGATGAIIGVAFVSEVASVLRGI